MQETRQHILEILHNAGQATVDDIVSELRKRRGEITAVTVRHHLARLQQEELITAPQLRHRSSPGRPQHVYALTDKARDHFPNNYQRLAAGLINQIKAQLPPDGVNVILEGVATEMAAEANIADAPIEEKMRQVVGYLNDNGYVADWEQVDGGFVLHTSNCPYHHISKSSQSLCEMDMRLVSSLLGVVPRRITRIADGDNTCSYMIPCESVTNGN